MGRERRKRGRGGLRPRVSQLPPPSFSPTPSANRLPLLLQILKSGLVIGQWAHGFRSSVTLEQSAHREDRAHTAAAFSARAETGGEARAWEGPQIRATHVASPATYATQQHQVLRPSCEGDRARLIIPMLLIRKLRPRKGKGFPEATQPVSGKAGDQSQARPTLPICCPSPQHVAAQGPPGFALSSPHLALPLEQAASWLSPMHYSHS